MFQVSRAVLVHWFAWISAAVAQRDLQNSGARFVPASYFTKFTITDLPSSQIKFSENDNSIGITVETPIAKVVSHNCSESECKMLIDLGKNYYPRFIQEVLCKPPRTPKIYTFKVLTKKGDSSRVDREVPESLRLFWKFVELKVPVACDCPFKF